ncbi:MAG: efflux RND transporter periplasmic adaptor subunit [Candidatus Eremiobacteraeota bacterium]|nr:efflux RND transporter periplasmic adaptor subunit [Candidatus Eremiobacteraeota bacterium]
MNCKLVVFLGISVLAACGSKAPPPNTQPTNNPGVVHQPAVAVQTEVLRRSSLQGTITAGGQVVADSGGQATLAFPTDGQIATVNVSIGDRVSAGEVLATLDSRLAFSAIRQAQADVVTAQANLAKAAAGARPQELAGNSALVQGAQAKADAAKAELNRQQALAQAGISSQRDLQQARSDYENAFAALRSTQEQGSLLVAGPRPQDVNLARSQVQQAQAALAAAQTKASLLNIVAPFAGIVTQRLKNPGETADPTIPVIAMVNPDRTIVEVQISQDQAGLIQQGDPATIAMNGLSRSLSGRVQAVSAAFGQDTRTMTVRIKPYGDGLTPGAAAKATIVIRSLSDAFVVPDSAIVKNPDTGRPLIYLATGSGHYRAVNVQILLQSGSRTAIAAAGLESGVRIVTQGAYELLPFAGVPSGG